MSTASITGKCHPHTGGVPAGAPPFFYPDCSVCQAKKAAGKVRGNEGPLPTAGWKARTAKKGDQAKFAAQAKRDRAGRKAARGNWVG